MAFKSVLSPLWGRRQTKLVYRDEVNVFRWTLLYAGPPYSGRWYDVAGSNEKARALIYLRRREGAGTGAFRKVLHDRLVPALVDTGALKELRTQVFMPWSERRWDAPTK